MLEKSLLIGAMLCAPALAQVCSHIQNVPPGTNLGLSDDSVAWIQLPFAFPFGGTQHQVLTVSSNGWVKFGIATDSDHGDDEPTLVSEGPRIAVCWDDWNVSSVALPGGSGIFYNETASTAHVIWKDVPRFGSTTIFANMELVLSASGRIDLHYLPSHGAPLSSSIVGISAGNGAQPNALDLSTLPATTTPTIANATGYELFPSGAFDLAGTTLTLTPTAASDYHVTLGAPSSCPTTTGPVLPSYGSGAAWSYGHGCPIPGSGTWFELFGANAFDLSGSSWRFSVATGNRYVVSPGTGFDQGYGAADVRAQGDDTQVLGDLSAMGGFPFRGATLASVAACSNGFLWLAPNQSNDWTCSIDELASLDSRLAVAWSDWTFALGGTFYWTATPTHCLATWENVAAYPHSSTANTFQCKLYPNGDIEFNYLSLQNTTATNSGRCLVGLSGGASTPRPQVDVNTTTGTLLDLTSNTAVPLAHGSNAPKVGTDYRVRTNTLPNGAVFGVTLLGLRPGGIDLGPFGAPGCTQHVDTIGLFIHALSGGSSFSDSIPIPVNLDFHGIELHSQGAVYVPGINALGLVTSNGRVGRIGL